MSEEIKTSTPLQEAFRAARRAAGKQAVHMVLVSHGSRSGHLEDVPAARQEACRVALEKLARDGAPADTKASADPFDSIRSKAFAVRETPKPAATFDALHDQAYARFNNPPTCDDG